MAMERFIFSGAEKLFIVKSGVLNFDVQIHLYSDWKDHLVTETGNPSKFGQALRTVGGDTLTEQRKLGDTYFLSSGWRIRPFEGNHTLTVSGNLFTDDGGPVFIATTGAHTVLVQQFQSNLIDTLSITADIATIPADTVTELKSSTWSHSLGTANLNFQDAFMSLVGMAQGRIVNSSSGVFDFYDNDNSNVIFTLVESGLERLRQ